MSNFATLLPETGTEVLPTTASLSGPIGALCIMALAVAPRTQDPILPPQLEGLPGNAATSMPIRWSQGVMQVIWNQGLIPAGLKGRTVTSLRLRRPAFPDEPGYGPIQRTVRISMGMTSLPAGALGAELAANRPETLVVVAGPKAIAFSATPAHGPGDATAEPFVQVALDQPFTVGSTGNLFLEWENIDSSLSVSNGHWADAVEMPSSGGIAVEVGNGGCGSVTSTRPMVLRWGSGNPPASGQTASLRLQGSVPGAPAVVILGLDPQHRQPPIDLGFGAELGFLAAPGCHQWTGVDLSLAGETDAIGGMAVDLPFPSGVDLAGKRVGVQVLVLDPQANPVGVGMSNGVVLHMDTLQFNLQCGTILMPGEGDRSPFQPFFGVAPIVGFGL